ncbi:hypothetical protein CGJ21_04800 [Vibrio parahaemolyticus]|uniref:glycosyltransferase family 4 protein n=2 Tax=Vibrio parahaemolyticus TaxID=670 RepID=UPI0011203E6E|nr:glycosyltransferase family 4 protein [Vibrio parahaemolyticus]TOF41926.1 hypothetical protein CGJ23_01155 [Vibrio parahaemolyticus]TOF50427.1 hypothetical protein CGJ21_04800 [Vibrio parahaemolyticus]HCG5236628.1 hypothetical protein [Vibrio parahaemolyticus]
MKLIKFLPEIESKEQFDDLISRAAWHLNILEGYSFEVYFSGYVPNREKIECPDGFDLNSQACISEFLNRTKLTEYNGLEPSICDNAAAIIKWKEDDDNLNDFLKKNAKCTIYRTDPILVRQEGSFYIQCAFDLTENKQELISESGVKFQKLFERIGTYKSSWVLATGPSIENYVNHDFSSSLTIACNSTIFDDDLVSKTNPLILVFADPIFHFGISEYAGKFRAKVSERMSNNHDLTIVVPFKYYRLLTNIFPQFRERIIGVPFVHDKDFNFNLQSEFYVKTTSNILTLLLLPVAGTFSKNINILGCDGRPFENDDYFWGHGDTVQINDKMKNIQQVHPGFFDIDYNEYYFEHCHTLECLFQKGESSGMSFVHHADSYIPALRDRNSDFKVSNYFANKHCLLLEPDGIGGTGHYVNWYNQVIDELAKRNNSVRVFCNKKQDVKLYNAAAENVFSSHSWGISRGDWCFARNFKSHTSYVTFFDQLKSATLKYCKDNEVDHLTVFMYYGSVQILAGLHELRTDLKREGIALSVSICLFHESVILSDKVKAPRIPPQARSILMEGLAQSDSYNITSVTKELSDNLYNQIGVRTDVMPNPIPAGQYEEGVTTIHESKSSSYRVVFPCALRDEKGSNEVYKLLVDIRNGNVDLTGIEIVCRKPSSFKDTIIPNVSWICDDLSEEQYRSLLSSADIVVIPYLAPQFSYRTSGIIVDALYARKPLIVMENTWLASVVKEYYCGLAIKYFSSWSFISSIRTIKDKGEFLRSNAVNSYNKYKIDNSWCNLVKIMFDK